MVKIFESFFPQNEHVREDKRFNKELQFQREQGAIAAGIAGEQTEILERENKSDLIKWQQELDDEQVKLVMHLKGYVMTDDGWSLPKGKRPLCNNTFINDVVVPQTTPFMSRNLINSNLSEDMTRINLASTCNEIADNMVDGYDIYEIDFKNYDLIIRLIKNTIMAGAFRAVNGWTAKTNATIFKRIESAHENPQPVQKKGLFGIN